MATSSTPPRYSDGFDAFAGNPDFVLSLARGLELIESFQRVADALSVSEISSDSLVTRVSSPASYHARIAWLMTAEFLPVLRQQASLLGSMLA